jgi:thiol-disulfide isomerase/thioredoxin
MVGYGPEKENFALELTYNYGIDSYESGDDLQCIALSCPFALERAKLLGYSVIDDIIIAPDNYKFKIVPSIQGRAERFHHVSIRVSNIAVSKLYWGSLLGMAENSDEPTLSDSKSVLYSFGCGQVSLRLVQLADIVVPIEHGLSGGRAAFACPTPAVKAIHSMVETKDIGSILTPPLTLPTPGKADVVVTILSDPDGYEICFVEDAAFYDLATPTYDVVDWILRASRGGDGAPPPKGKLEHGPTMCGVASEEELNQLFKEAAKRAILLEFGAGWCRNCKKLGPVLEELATTHAGQLVVAAVDIDEAQDLADIYNIRSVPHVVLLKLIDEKWEKAFEISGPSKD